jgi:hypothetical protein
MADELLCCPTCNRKVRLAEKHHGWIVQCPLCGAVFRAPVGLSPAPTLTSPAARPAPVPAPAVEKPVAQWTRKTVEEEADPEAVENTAHRTLLVPGLMLLVQGVVALLVVLAPALRGPNRIAEFWQEYIDRDASKNYPSAFVSLLRETPPVALTALSAALSVGTVIGAVHILRLRRYSLALAGSALVMGNLFYPGCQWYLNWFLGIWTIRTLRSPEVRDAFE